MRVFLTISALVILAISGCIDSDGQGVDGSPMEAEPEGRVGASGETFQESERPPGETTSKNESAVAEGRANYTFPDGYPEFCDENQQGNGLTGKEDCTFYDEIFHGYTLYDIDTTKIDVLIVPPASPEAARDIVTLRLAVESWRDGIYELGEPWFVEHFQMNVYVAGEDIIPADALEDPEIIVIAAEANPAVLFGIGLEPFDFLGLESPCRNGGEASRSYEDHAHDGMAIKAAECEEGGFTCAAINTNFLAGGGHRMYDLVAHEVGHCLGPGHVGDALDFAAKRVPISDIMSYTTIEGQVHCVSNLNVRVIEGIYGDLIASRPETAAPLLNAGEFVHMHPGDYHNVECANPEIGLIS
jgi:hypothetical protein